MFSLWRVDFRGHSFDAMTEILHWEPTTIRHVSNQTALFYFAHCGGSAGRECTLFEHDIVPAQIDGVKNKQLLAVERREEEASGTNWDADSKPGLINVRLQPTVFFFLLLPHQLQVHNAEILVLLISLNKCSSIQTVAVWLLFFGILFLYNYILLPLRFPKTANNTSYIMQPQIYSEGFQKKKKT